MVDLLLILLTVVIQLLQRLSQDTETLDKINEYLQNQGNSNKLTATQIEKEITNITNNSDFDNETLELTVYKKNGKTNKFIIKIEKQGGEFEEYINIILSDIKEWSDRTELFRRDIDRIRRNVLISIGATLLTCGFMAYLIPKEYSFTGNIVYQISSMIIILIMLLLFP